MSKKIEIIGKSLVITDTVSSEVILDVPKSEYYYKIKKLVEDSQIVLYNLDFKDNINSKPALIFLSEAVDSALTPYTEESFISFCRNNLGFKYSVSDVIIDPLNIYPVENEYVDVATMLADQVNQTTNYFQYVSGTDEYYEYLGTTNALITDYRLLSDTEVTVLQGNGGWKVFRVGSINNDATPATTIQNGRIAIDYNNGTGYITSFLFNSSYSDTIANLVADGTNWEIQFYNQQSRIIYTATIDSFTTVGNYIRANVTSTIDRTEFSVNNQLEVTFDRAGGGVGGSGLPIVNKTGTSVVFTEDAFYNADVPLTSGNYIFDNTGAIDGATVILYADKYIPTFSGMPYLISGVLDSSKLNLIWCTYDGNYVQMTVINKSYLLNPSFLVTEGVTSNIISNFAVPNSTNYEILFNIVENSYVDQAAMFADQASQTTGLAQYSSADNAYYEYLGTSVGNITDYLALSATEYGSAITVPTYNGTDTTYEHASLASGTQYIYFVKTSSNNLGYLDSNYGIGVGTPDFGNTLIGGLAATYPTETDLATFLGITDADISNYTIYNTTDISCNINTTYSLPANAFKNNATIKWFVDTNGQCTSSGAAAFENADALQYVDMRGVMASPPQVYLCAVVEYVNAPNVTGGTISINRNPLLKWFNAGAANNLGSYSIATLTSVESLYLPSVVGVVGANAARDNSGKLILEIPNATTMVASNIFYLSGNINNIWLFDGVTTFGISQMCRSFNGELYIPNVSTNIGGVATDSGTFLNIVSTSKIYAHNNLATNNGGGIDGDLAYAIGRGVTVVFITNTTPPDAVIDLAASNITTNSVDLTLTQPASTNAFQHYDVYIDKGEGAGYRLLNKITATGDTISNLPSGTQIKIKVKTVDEFRNRSGFSNEIIFTTL